MASRSTHWLLIPWKGGLDTTTASVLLQPGQLTTADNIEYEEHGGSFKRGGSRRFNAVVASLSGTVGQWTALVDFWRHGTSLTPAQLFVGTLATSGGGAIVSLDNTGAVTTLKAPWGAIRETNLTVAQGYVVVSDGVEQPQRYDQSTVATLSMEVPRFQDAVYHLRRLFYWGMSGTATASSTVGVTAAGDIAQATGSDASVTAFILDEDDGDRVIGCSEPWRGSVYAFKGPVRGSCWELGGTSLSTFTKSPVFKGAAPCIAAKSIVTTSNDVYWMSRYGVHSLITTQKFGNTEEAYLSRPIQETFNALNMARLSQAVGFYNPTRNCVGWCVPAGSSTTNDKVLVYNYLVQQWSIWDWSGFDGAAAMVAIDPTSGGSQRLRLYVGDYAGFVHACDDTTIGDSNVDMAYTAKVRTPALMTFPGKDAITEASFESVTTFYRPVSNSSANLVVTVDGRSKGYSVTMDPPGAVLGSFVLGVDVLGGNDSAATETIIEERGRTIQLEYAMPNLNADLQLQGFGLRYAPGETRAHESS